MPEMTLKENMYIVHENGYLKPERHTYRYPTEPIVTDEEFETILYNVSKWNIENSCKLYVELILFILTILQYGYINLNYFKLCERKKKPKTKGKSEIFKN